MPLLFRMAGRPATLKERAVKVPEVWATTGEISADKATREIDIWGRIVRYVGSLMSESIDGWTLSLSEVWGYRCF